MTYLTDYINRGRCRELSATRLWYSVS